ncbi:MAG: Ribosomal protein methyltransferase [Myxococcaceae bacterium]|jgi:ribosomal protein L11 methyltransferase|nr:Ribosomal protein methyltransferase [Myxococcaceae bacterium]MEA2746392.1 ribosomal protein methyltransferase [Myxococcales bacterium]
MTMSIGEPRYPFVHVDVAPDDVDEISGLLFELGAEGVEERDETTLAKNATSGKVTLVGAFSTREDADQAILELDAALDPRYEEVVGDGWRDAWKEHYKPYAIAEGLVVRPPWEAYEAKPGEKVLELEPGRAFGTGLHETTRLVVQAIKKYASEANGRLVIDVGCGSGILALAAVALGAERAIAIDNDPEAIDVTRENAARNGLAERIEASTTDVAALDATAPLVLANIEAHVLIPMAPELMKRVAPGGLLFLSGVLVPQTQSVQAAYVEHMDVLETPVLGEWTLIALRKKQ